MKPREWEYSGDIYDYGQGIRVYRNVHLFGRVEYELTVQSQDYIYRTIKKFKTLAEAKAFAEAYAALEFGI